MKINTSEMEDIAGLLAEDSADQFGFVNLAKEAYDFISKQDWCNRVIKGFMAEAYEGILGVFLFEIEPKYKDIDNQLWVISGDVPPAYIVTDDCPNGQSALRGYVLEMNQWVEAVEQNMSIDDLIPVNAVPSKENASLLRKRLEFIRNEILDNN